MLRSASSEEAEGSAPPDASSDHEARQSSPAPVSQLEEALQYMLYLVEDIDHAKGWSAVGPSRSGVGGWGGGGGGGGGLVL